MNRRQFSRAIAGAALGAAVLPSPSTLRAEEDQPSLPFKLSVMIWTLGGKLSLQQRLETVAQAGYHSVELTGDFLKWSPEDFRKFDSLKRSLGVGIDATGGFNGGVGDPERRDDLLAQLKYLVTYCDRLQCWTFIILSGNRIPTLSGQQQHDACIETLKRMGDIAAQQNVTVLLENIDPEENPKYYLTSSAEGFEIIRKVDHPNVKFLYDLYHEQIAEGNLIEKLEKNIGYLGLIHIADVPGRHEPGTGEINYASVFRKLAELKYNKYAAMEFLPTDDPVASLRGAFGHAQQKPHHPEFSPGMHQAGDYRAKSPHREQDAYEVFRAPTIRYVPAGNLQEQVTPKRKHPQHSRPVLGPCQDRG